MPGCPSEFGLAEFSGQVRFRRRFGYPGRIDEFERVWLTIHQIYQPLDISLNGKKIGTISGNTQSGEFDVTKHLQARNEIVVDVQQQSGSGDEMYWQEAALEIRRTAYLRDIKVQWKNDGINQQLEVTGLVAGQCERPLDLYVLVSGKTAAQCAIRADSAFELSAEIEDRTPFSRSLPNIEIELVDGGVVWYGVQVEFPSRPDQL